jgi:hypothetical protein
VGADNKALVLDVFLGNPDNSFLYRTKGLKTSANEREYITTKKIEVLQKYKEISRVSKYFLLQDETPFFMAKVQDYMFDTISDNLISQILSGKSEIPGF